MISDLFRSLYFTNETALREAMTDAHTWLMNNYSKPDFELSGVEQVVFNAFDRIREENDGNAELVNSSPTNHELANYFYSSKFEMSSDSDTNTDARSEATEEMQEEPLSLPEPSFT